jgi:hypothetical protein
MQIRILYYFTAPIQHKTAIFSESAIQRIIAHCWTLTWFLDPDFLFGSWLRH